tara:strand:+ start:820 stop:1356 length:537 start_codon:yes stop_codon:yes gene_type:complete
MLLNKSLNKFRDIIIKKCEESLKKTNLSNDKIFILLRFFHILPNFLLPAILLFSNSKSLILLILLIHFFVLFFYILFDGCILTRIELKFTKHYTTPFDYLLEFLNTTTYSNINYNIKKVGLNVLFSIFFVILFIYYIRFIKNIKLFNFKPNIKHIIGYIILSVVMSFIIANYDSIKPK